MQCRGQMVVIEIEQASGETPFYVLRYIDPETQTFATFAPTRDSYSIFAVAMKMAQIASRTRGTLRKIAEEGNGILEARTTSQQHGCRG